MPITIDGDGGAMANRSRAGASGILQPVHQSYDSGVCLKLTGDDEPDNVQSEMNDASST